METNKKCFIRTSDTGVKDILLSAGYPLVSSDRNSWVFLNNGNITDLPFYKSGKFSFTNKLNI